MIILFYFLFILQTSSLYFFQAVGLVDSFLYIYISLDVILLICLLTKELRGKKFLYALITLIVRFIVLIYMEITGLKLSLDWGNFLRAAIAYMDGTTDRVAMYPRLLTFFFTSTGFECNYTLMPIALNIFSSVINIYVVFLLLQYLKINKNISTYIICVLSFLPIQMGFSIEMVREAIPTLLISTSLLYFIKWFFSYKIHYIAIAFLCAAAAASFHAGCIAVALGYAFVFTFYNFKKITLDVSLKKILLYVPILILFGCYIVLNPDVFLGKFQNVTDLEVLEAELSGWSTNINAGSAYLSWLNGASLSVQLICLPLKAFYFLFSPIIFDVRGPQDLFVLFFDASIFIIAIVYYLTMKNKINNKRLRLLLSILFLILCIVACVFALGVSNTGTAMRHRNKFIAIPLVLFAITYTYLSTKTIRSINNFTSKGIK